MTGPGTQDFYLGADDLRRAAETMYRPIVIAQVDSLRADDPLFGAG